MSNFSTKIVRTIKSFSLLFEISTTLTICTIKVIFNIFINQIDYNYKANLNIIPLPSLNSKRLRFGNERHKV